MAQTAKKRKRPAVESAFHEDARSILAEVRERLAAVLNPALAGLEPGATEWARALRIDTKLAWKLTHLLDPDGDLESLQFVPGRQAFDQILVAAEKAGATREA